MNDREYENWIALVMLRVDCFTGLEAFLLFDP